jgi:hypothetical protein
MFFPVPASRHFLWQYIDEFMGADNMRRKNPALAGYVYGDLDTNHTHICGWVKQTIRPFFIAGTINIQRIDLWQ